MTKQDKNTKEDKVMVYHGGDSHEYGEPCEICEQMFRENPYGKIVIEKERQRAREKIENWVKSWGAVPVTGDYANGWNNCRTKLYKGWQRLEEEK